MHTTQQNNIHGIHLYMYMHVSFTCGRHLTMYCDVILDLQGAKVVAGCEQRECLHLRSRGHITPVDLEDTIPCLQNTLSVCGGREGGGRGRGV